MSVIQEEESKIEFGRTTEVLEQNKLSPENVKALKKEIPRFSTEQKLSPKYKNY
jgi:hypothetical protein